MKQKNLNKIGRKDMEKNTGWLAIVLVILALLVGGLIGANMVDPQVETKIVNNTVEKIVEVPTVETVIKNVTVTEEVFNPAIKVAEGVDDFLEEVEDNDNLLRCGLHEYDFDEVSVSRIYDEYAISGDDENSEVSFEVKLKYDEDSEKSCKRSFDVTVVYEEDEDPEVIIN